MDLIIKEEVIEDHNDKSLDASFRCGDIFQVAHRKFRYRCLLCFEAFDEPSDFENHFFVNHSSPFNQFEEIWIKEKDDVPSCNQLLRSPCIIDNGKRVLKAFVNNKRRKNPKPSVQKRPEFVSVLSNEPIQSPGCIIDNKKPMLKTPAKRRTQSPAQQQLNRVIPALSNPSVGSKSSNIDKQNSRLKKTLCTEVKKSRNETQSKPQKENVIELPKCDSATNLLVQPNTGSSIECPICQMQFKNRAECRKHRKDVHVKKYQCDMCGLEFDRKYFHLHVITHTDVKPFKCTICDSSFRKSYYLELHMRMHTNDRRYKCELCDKAFIRAFRLKQHKLMHANAIERNYKCEQCGFRTLTPAKLRDHVRTHTGEKPFTCDRCGNKFSQQRNLRAHLVKFHLSKESSSDGTNQK